MARWKSETHRNLTLRPAKPALGNGGAQKHARWALWALGEANTREILDYTLPRLLELDPPKNHDYRTARRALESIGAVRVGRAGGRGRPWKWRLKDELSSDNANENNGADQKK